MSQDSHEGRFSELSPGEVRARAVEEVLRDQAAKTQVRTMPSSAATTTWNRVVALVLVSLAAIYVWVAAPRWIGPAAAEPIPLVQEEAGLRLAVYLQAQRIQDYRDRRGRLPDVLEEAGESLPGLRYERVDARTYRIRAFGERSTVLYVSSDSLRLFAGEADRVLGVGGP